MVSDIPVDDEASVVTSIIFRSAGAQSFGGAHRGRVCVRVFIGCECVCVLWASSLYCVILKKRFYKNILSVTVTYGNYNKSQNRAIHTLRVLIRKQDKITLPV